MKTTRLLNILLLFVILLPGMVTASEKEQFTKERRISKTYIVNANAGLEISNKFGQVYVTTWDEDKTSIEILIRISAKNEETVNKRLSTIDIEFEAFKSLIKAKTLIGSFSGRSVNMEINYTVKIPKNGSINLDNKYGTIKFGSINGASVLKCQYGDVYGEALNNSDNTISVEYCGNSKIGYMKSGTVKAQYSGFNLLKGNSIVLNSDYTDASIGQVNEITYRCNYGDLKIIDAAKISGTANYTNTKVANVSAQLNLSTNYGDVNVTKVDKSTRNISINSTYASVKLNYDSDYAFDFEYQLEYGGISGAGDLKFTQKSEKNSKASYKGYYKSSGVNRMYIKTEYGDIKLTKN